MNYTGINSLYELRKRFRYTQSDLAFIIGISCRSYRSKEKGESYFTQEEILKIILLFDLDKDDIYNLFFNEKNNRIMFIKSNLKNFSKKEYIKDILILKHKEEDKVIKS